MGTRPDIIKHYTEIQKSDESHYRGSDELLSIGAPFGKFFGFQQLGIHHELLKLGCDFCWTYLNESSEPTMVYPTP